MTRASMATVVVDSLQIPRLAPGAERLNESTDARNQFSQCSVSTIQIESIFVILRIDHHLIAFAHQIKNARSWGKIGDGKGLSNCNGS
jgi:hypothetical protein